MSNAGVEITTFPGTVFILIEYIASITSEPEGAKISGLEIRGEELQNALYHINLNLRYLKSKLLFCAIFRAVKDDNLPQSISDSYKLITNIIADLEKEYSTEFNDTECRCIVKEIENLPDSSAIKGKSQGEIVVWLSREIGLLRNKYDPIRTFIARIVAAHNLLFKIADLLGVKLSMGATETIVRSIEFPPELKHACIGVLSYFSHVLSVKYPADNVGVKIEQLGDRVILIIDTPGGKKDRIEKDLSDYGLVVIGELAPELLLKDPFEVLRLKQKLEIAALELRQTKELLCNERSHFRSRIESLEDETKKLWRLLDVQQHEKQALISIFNDSYAYANAFSKEHLQTLVGLVEQGTLVNQREIKELIDNIRANDKGLWTYFEELIIKGSIQGTAGNILYAFLKSIAFSIH